MDKIAVLDYGGQYAHLIANRVRRLGVYSEILPANASPDELKQYKGLILSGGPQSVHAEGGLSCNPEILHMGLPVLGICYGHQVLTHELGGKVESGEKGEYGKAALTTTTNPLFEGINETEQVWMSHFDEVTQIPEGATLIGSTTDCQNAAIDYGNKRWSVQFHLEVTHTPNGMKILDNYLNQCDLKREWSLDQFIEQELGRIKNQAGDQNVFLLISGGVDSTVAFMLLEKALGADRVYGLFVDHGLMRKNEGAQVKASLEKLGVTNLHVYQGEEEFLSALEGVYEPEEKRKIIGDKFLDVQRKVAAELNLNPDEWLLGQGTIYPDTIESGGTEHADKIKTHHNRVPQIEELIRQGKIIEPIKELYKDEVRAVGEKLGLESSMVWRHPFPGPGLGVRCLCAPAASPAENTPELESQINEFLASKNLNLTAAVLPLKSVGVQGDVRSYRHPVVLSGQATWAQLEAISPQLTNQFLEINRVLYHLRDEAIQSTQVTPKFSTRDRLDLLREADAIVQKSITEADLLRVIWQFPVVLLPLSINDHAGESVVLRPVSSEEAMTANFTEIEWPIVHGMTDQILALGGVSTVFYDITNKPPGTIEWE
jgi:GMP synthase (glutamine-hydrolysing)